MLHGGDIYAHEQLIEKNREGLFLDYSVNTNPLGMPPRVRDAICAHADEYQRYPDPSCRALRAGLSVHEGVPADHICCGNGAADLIFRLCLVRKPRRALICAPAFSEYERAVRLAGGEMVFHYLKEAEGFALGRRFLEDLGSGPDMAFLCNPNNPTGRLIAPELLADILLRCRELRILLVMDECFLPFTPAESLAANLGASLVVLKAFTKTFSMAGLRLGYILAADAALIAAVADTGQCWSVSAPAQAAGIAALECTDWVEQGRVVIDTGREFLSRELGDMGLKVFDSDANFLLFRSNAPLMEALIAKGILIRNCGNFQGLDEQYYRICVKQGEHNERLIAALREVLHEQKN